MNTKILAVIVAGTALMSFISLSSAETMAKKITMPLMYIDNDVSITADPAITDMHINRYGIIPSPDNELLSEEPMT